MVFDTRVGLSPRLSWAPLAHSGSLKSRVEQHSLSTISGFTCHGNTSGTTRYGPAVDNPAVGARGEPGESHLQLINCMGTYASAHPAVCCSLRADASIPSTSSLKRSISALLA